MNVVFRDARADDAEALACFMRESWVATFGALYAPEDLDAYLTQKYGAEIQRAEICDPDVTCRLALDDTGEIIGFCMVAAHIHLPVDDPGGVELERLYVAEHVKGSGVAATLMEFAIAWARGRCAQAMYLGVWEENHRAQRFYRRFGFEHYGEWQFMVGNHADRDLIFRLAL